MAVLKSKGSHFSKMENDELVGLRKELEAEINRRLSDMQRQVEKLRQWTAEEREIPIPFRRRTGVASHGKASANGGAAGIRWGSKHNTLIAREIAKGPRTLDQLKAAGKKGDELSLYQAVLKLAKKGGIAKQGDAYTKGKHFPR